MMQMKKRIEGTRVKVRTEVLNRARVNTKEESTWGVPAGKRPGGVVSCASL